jgi:hypothetical protein
MIFHPVVNLCGLGVPEDSIVALFDDAQKIFAVRVDAVWERRFQRINLIRRVSHWPCFQR